MVIREKNKRRFARIIWLVVFASWLIGLLPAAALAADQNTDSVAAQVIETPETLWEKAVNAREAGDIAEAAPLFARIYEDFPKSPQAEEAMWQAAILYKKLAETADIPNWERVRDLFRRYGTDYPDSPHGAEAYFEVGIAHYQMHFYREALIYFKLFEKRYPRSPIIPAARYWQARTLTAVGRLAEAINLYQEVVKNKDESLQIKGLKGLGEAYAANNDYRKALESYEKITSRFPNYYFKDLDLLINMGNAYLHVGKEEEGRSQLFYYLNLTEVPQRRGEVLFEIAESFNRQGQAATAQKLYEKVLAEGTPGNRAVVLAKFRQAEYLDDPKHKLSTWQKKGDIKDPAGDKPYLNVLDAYQKEPIAQDARYGLFQRYLAREDSELAQEIGKGFLRSDTAGAKGERRKERIAEILRYLGEQLLAQEKYQDLYELYLAEYNHIKEAEDGRLLYLVGRALEALSLYKQASVVYYRALAWPLTEQDKLDLYYRRAEVYLILKDWQAADRLLTHLRKIYAEKKPVGEVYFLSGKYYEAQKKFDEALAMYGKAVEILTLPEKKPVYADAYLRMLVALGKNDMLQSALTSFHEKEWLTGEDLQRWYVKMGDICRQLGNKPGAIKMYQNALQENMPQSGEVVQSAHFSLGDLYLEMREWEKSREHFQKAKEGEDPLKGKLADERLNQVAMKQQMAGMDFLPGNLQ